MSAVRLVCPLCGAVVAEGVEPAPGGRCPDCGARHLGGADDVPAAAAAALAALGVASADPHALAQRLFELDRADPRAAQVAMTSDEREGFYRWWVFVRDDPQDPGRLLAALAGP